MVPEMVQALLEDDVPYGVYSLQYTPSWFVNSQQRSEIYMQGRRASHCAVDLASG